jgi:hypothetical protein
MWVGACTDVGQRTRGLRVRVLISPVMPYYDGEYRVVPVSALHGRTL